MSLVGEIPLVSRDTELDRIRTRLARPEPAAFVLAGASGLGKTRLVGEAAGVAAGLGFTTVRVVATRAAAAIPFGPFATFLPADDQPSTDLLGLLRAASTAILKRAAPGRRLLLAVDDAHLLDDGSAALVHQLVRERSCSVLASLRTPGPVPDSVTTLWKDGLAERIDLRPWTEAETATVLAAVLDGPVARGAVRQLWELSQGNALYLRELLIGAVASGALAKDGDIWSLARPLTPPGRLVELVAGRIAGLATGTVAVIELLAVGEPLGVTVLERLTDQPSLEDAEAQGLVQIGYDGRRAEARLAHPVYGEALRQSLPRSRLRRISGVLAGAVEATGARRRDDLLRLGRWKLDSGAPGEPELLDRAAGRAMQMFDVDLAARLARAALDAGAGAGAGLILGEAAFTAGRHQEAEAVLASLVPACRDDGELARVASARAHNFHTLIGDGDAAYAVLDEALGVITDPAARLELLGRLALLRAHEPDPAAALAAAQPLLASDDDTLASRGCHAAALALALLGRGDEAVSVAGTGLKRHRRAAEQQATGLHHGPETQLIGAIFGHLASGRLSAAATAAADGYQSCLRSGDKEGQATFLLLIGCADLERGDLANATAAFADGASVNRTIHDLPGLRWCLSGVVLAESMRGNAGPAEAAAAQRDLIAGGPMMIYEPDLIDRGTAWLCIAHGEVTRAGDILAAAAERAAARQMRVAEARLLHDLARIGQPERAASRLAKLAELTEGGYVPALARHAAALTHGDGDGAELAASASAFEEMGAALLAAEALAASAAAWKSAGLERPAAAAARRAAELAASCANPHTPALAAGGYVSRLTPREREVAGLAATGASSKEIAARLVLSVRTVENHLQNAYSKLGVTSREELTRLMTP